jgi:hypothetical protein
MSVLTNETFDKSLTSNRTFHLSQERQIESCVVVEFRTTMKRLHDTKTRAIQIQQSKH